LILSRQGNSQETIAEQLDRDQKTISNWLGENEEGNFLLSEELLQEATEDWSDDNSEVTEIVEDLREEQIFGHWSDEERTLLDALREGENAGRVFLDRP
jgi:transposase